MTMLARNIDAQNADSLRSLALQIEANETIWSDVMSLRNTQEPASWTTTRVTYPVYGADSQIVVTEFDFVRYAATSQMIAVTGNFVPVTHTIVQEGNSRWAYSSVAQPIAPRAEVPRSELVDRIGSERLVAEIDDESMEVADAAVNDAVEVIRRANLSGAPRVMFSSDGILTLQWQRGEYGAALVFAGDGLSSIAFKRPGQLYAENGIEMPVSEDLPAEFAETLAVVLA